MKKLFVVLMAVMVALPPAQAQERQPYAQAELDQMLAPIALYPDALLSQVLMAATYPLEVVEAARWSRAHPGLQGDEAVRAAQDKDWDPSVKSLLAFPNLLSRMDEKLEWTKQLGDAFLAQEQQVMDAVQDLRRKAQAAGQLAPDERVRVVEDGGTIVIEAANPRVVYVPYYDPWVVYGPWWWSAYPPVGWAPWPGYVAYRPGFWWGVGVTISSGFFFGSVSWPHRHVVVTHVNNYYLRPSVIRRDVVVRPIAPGRWQHDPSHRRGIVYRSPEVQRRFTADAQWQRGAPRPAAVAPAPRPAAVAPAPRRVERPESRPVPRREGQREERRDNRRDDRRGQAMPPAFRAASPPARAEAPRAVQPRIAAQQPQPRVLQPRIEAQQPQPRVLQPRIEAQQPQPRAEPRAQQRVEQRGGGNGGGNAGGRGGWAGQGNRGNGNGRN